MSLARVLGRLVVPLILMVPCAAVQSQDDEAGEVDVEVCLAVDGSGSIDEGEFRLQREAYAAAIADPRVVNVIGSGYRRKIVIAMMEWGDAESMNPITPWTVIENANDANAFGGLVRAAPRLAWGWNSISNAIAFCHAWMDSNDFKGERRVIDVSGDAGQNGGMPLERARSLAVQDGIIINALALNYRSGGLTGPFGTPLIDHYRRDVIGGYYAFALPVDSPEGFKEALVRKLILEIAGRYPATAEYQGQ